MLEIHVGRLTAANKLLSVHNVLHLQYTTQVNKGKLVIIVGSIWHVTRNYLSSDVLRWKKHLCIVSVVLNGALRIDDVG